jgi:hypothetical protein
MKRNQFTKLTRGESQRFEQIRTLDGKSICLMRGTYRGDRAAIICFVSRADSAYVLEPVAMLLRREDLNHLTDAEGRALP